MWFDKGWKSRRKLGWGVGGYFQEGCEGVTEILGEKCVVTKLDESTRTTRELIVKNYEG